MAEIYLWLCALTFVAAVLYGAVGYGLSSIIVPVALLSLDSRTINPALVVVSIVANTYALAINRRHLRVALPMAGPLMMGLPAGIAAGSALLSCVDTGRTRVLTLAILAPLALLQSAGWQRPLRSPGRSGPFVGGGLGALFAVTTISGPPLVMLLANQGLVHGGFRAALALVRLTASLLTSGTYAVAGLMTADSLALLPSLMLGLAAGLPLGARLAARIPRDLFRRLCLSLDAWLIGGALATVLRGHAGLALAWAGAIPVVLVAADAMLFRRFLARRRRHPPVMSTSGVIPCENDSRGR